MIVFLWPFTVGLMTYSWLIGCGKKKPNDKIAQPACVKTSKDSKEKAEEKKEEKPEEKKPEEKKDEEKKEEEKKEDEKKEEEKDDAKKNDKADEEKKDDELKPHITVEPSLDLTFFANQTEQRKITIKNIHDKKIMFKIKCSDITVYPVNPVFGTLEPGKTADVTITHNKTPGKEGKLVIVNSVFTGDPKDLAKSFRTGKPTGGQVIVKLNAK